jgi:hypothetical protein
MIDVGGDETASWHQRKHIRGTYDDSQHIHERLVRALDTKEVEGI